MSLKTKEFGFRHLDSYQERDFLTGCWHGTSIFARSRVALRGGVSVQLRWTWSEDFEGETLRGDIAAGDRKIKIFGNPVEVRQQ